MVEDVRGDHGRDDAMEVLDKLRLYGVPGPMGGIGGIGISAYIPAAEGVLLAGEILTVESEGSTFVELFQGVLTGPDSFIGV